MDNQLIDSLIAGLFDTPREERTPQQVQSLLLFIAEAAEVQLNVPSSIQLEQLKLMAAVTHLAEELKAIEHFTSLHIAPDRQFLVCKITLLKGTPEHEWRDEVSVSAIESTAERVLRKLRARVDAVQADIKAAGYRAQVAA